MSYYLYIKYGIFLNQNLKTFCDLYLRPSIIPDPKRWLLQGRPRPRENQENQRKNQSGEQGKEGERKKDQVRSAQNLFQISSFSIPYLLNQGVTKRCRLSWLTNSALLYEPKCGVRGGGVAGSRPISTAVLAAVPYTGAQINFGELTPYLKVPSGQIGSAWECYHWKAL